MIMKKIVLTIVAMLSMTFAYAENENVNAVNDVKTYDMSLNYKRLAVCLGLNLDQMEAVEDIHQTFCAEMMNAATASKDEKAEMVQSALKKDLTYMRYVLDEKQYRKYETLLNVTFNNRGLNQLVSEK